MYHCLSMKIDKAYHKAKKDCVGFGICRKFLAYPEKAVYNGLENKG